MLRHALLGLLARDVRHGYELKNALEQALGGSWDINFGQIYATLQRLERDGLVNAVVDAKDRRGKKTYELTEQGRKELESWFDQPVEKSRRLRYSDALDMIARQRQAYLQRVRDLTRLAADAPKDPFVSLLIEGAILHLQADLRWLDLCDERLERLKDKRQEEQ